MIRAEVGHAVRRALDLICEHPGVRAVGAAEFDEASGIVTVEATFAVNLPSEWRGRGESPSGVRLREEVRFGFPGGFPLDPPELSLRGDFSRNLPHMQPWLVEGRPAPCIYDGELAELLHSEGMAGILNQTAVWLERAALGTLIHPDQGWEPIRRDSFRHVVVADADFLRGLVDRRGGHRFLEMQYLRWSGIDGSPVVHGQIGSARPPVSRRSVGGLFGEGGVGGEPPLWRGRSLALVVWPGKHPSGAPIVNDTYLPETVQDVDGLRQRAALYGCRKDLDAGLNWLGTCLSAWPHSDPCTMAVILLARRPFAVIGSASPIELCPYVMEIASPRLLPDGEASPVRPAAHRNTISRDLLARMAGLDAMAEAPAWTLVGAGSLGSKVALHLARAGRGPSTVIDRSAMAPHNAARQSLVPPAGELQIFWNDAKARMLAQALQGLDKTTTPIAEDAVRMLVSGKHAKGAWSRKSWAVVNATASPVVREAFAASDAVPARVVETSLFAGGRVGVVTVEGPDRNPSTTDLMAEFYALLGEQPELASIVFDRDASVSRQETGQGCGSLTMAMSDGRLSLFAAAMSEHLLVRQRQGLPGEDGELLLGRLSEDGLGLTWRAHRVSPLIVVPARNGEAWKVHVHPRALTKMQDDVSRWPGVETGGVIMGRLSEVSRVAHVVDVIEAPADSRRARDEFVLGTEGLQQRMREYSDTIGWSLYCLGTWHSHLSPGGPSAKDRATARAVALARLTPSIFLITTPTGFHALAAGTSPDAEG